MFPAAYLRPDDFWRPRADAARKATEGVFTYVAVDEDGHPVPVSD